MGQRLGGLPAAIPKRRVLTAAATMVGLVMSMAVAPVGAASAQQSGPVPVENNEYVTGNYLVTFRDSPIAAYDGHVRGLDATRPEPGAQVDTNSPAAQE